MARQLSGVAVFLPVGSRGNTSSGEPRVSISASWDWKRDAGRSDSSGGGVIFWLWKESCPLVSDSHGEVGMACGTIRGNLEPSSRFSWVWQWAELSVSQGGQSKTLLMGETEVRCGNAVAVVLNVHKRSNF